MSAQLRFIDTDGTTVITTINLGNIDTPGQSAQKKIYVENFGDQTAQDVDFSAEAVGTNDGVDYAEIAPDVTGSPGTFSAGPLTLGDIASLARVAVWTQTVLPSGLTSDNNPRQYELLAAGTTI